MAVELIDGAITVDGEVVVPAPKPARMIGRGTSNGNARGGSEDRRRRREYLVETYRADADLSSFEVAWGAWEKPRRVQVPFGSGEPACRCYRCGLLLSVDTVTVDRIVPGAEGGTYRRNNIRPACGTCNSSTGQALSMQRRKAK